MSSKSWLLNAAAIKVARECIRLVERELDIRLTLSHPDFLELLQEYSELTDSAELMSAVRRLIDFAGSQQVESQTLKHADAGGGHTVYSRASSTRSATSSQGAKSRASVKNVVSISSESSAVPTLREAVEPDRVVERRQTDSVDRNEIVMYNGKPYRRWHNGKEFKGLYRGQARYA